MTESESQDSFTHPFPVSHPHQVGPPTRLPTNTRLTQIEPGTKVQLLGQQAIKRSTYHSVYMLYIYSNMCHYVACRWSCLLFALSSSSDRPRESTFDLPSFDLRTSGAKVPCETEIFKSIAQSNHGFCSRPREAIGS